MMVKTAIKKAKKEMQHPGITSYILLVAMLGIGFGKWGELQEIKSAGELLLITNIFSALQYLLPTIVTFLTKGVMK